MNVTLQQVDLEPSEHPALSVIRWDDESLVLSVSLLTEAAPTRSMAHLMDIDFGIQPALGRVVIGDLMCWWIPRDESFQCRFARIPPLGATSERIAAALSASWY
jgi:hypothetical protein